MSNSHRSRYQVHEFVRQVRRRWRIRALLRGTAVTLGLLLVTATLLLVLQRVEAPAMATLVVGVVGFVAVVAGSIRWLIRPGFRRITERDVALFIEERMPDLEDRLNSAIEVGDDQETRVRHGHLIDTLLEDGARLTRGVELGNLVDPARERWLALGTGLLAVALLLFATTSLDEVGEGVRVAVASTATEQPFLLVTPGTVEVEQGASQEVVAELREDEGDEVVLHHRTEEGQWQTSAMQSGLDTKVHLFEFPSLQESVEYFVQVGDVRSDVYTLQLYTYPMVERIDLTYTFPEYTGLDPVMEADMGDIRGLAGSTVTVAIETTDSAEDGAMVFGDGSETPLRRASDGRFLAQVPLEEDGTYTIRLTDAAGKTNRFPEEYSITALEDLKPIITVTDPQRDVRVNAVEEVLVSVRVVDDFGVDDVALRFTVNGEEEQTARPVGADSLGRREVNGSHLFYLEEYSLEPGDVISYHVEASDSYHEDPEASDMYFIEIIPFDQQFRQANNMSGSGMSGQPSQIVLSQQQIISATWRLIRERDDMVDGEFDDAAEALAQAQATLKENIEQRINSTTFSFELMQSEESRIVVEHLRQAVVEMEKAYLELVVPELRDALTPERRALNHLLKADAQNRERQVAMNRSGNQGGGGSAAEERMTELMDLELDISKDKYEMQQQAPSGGQQGEMDEALRKVQELARKQENLANQMARDMPEDERRRQVERLKRDQDELRRQAEQLSRSMRRSQSAEGRQMQQQMDQVIDDMRRAEQALRRGDAEESMARQQQAMNRLEDMQRRLERVDNDDMRADLEDLARDFEAMTGSEEQLSEDLARARREAEARGGVDPQQARTLSEQRRELAEELSDLDGALGRLEEEATGEQRDLGRIARNMRQQIRRESLRELMEDSERALAQGWLDHARELQDDIEGGMRRLQERMDDLAGGLPETGEEQLARSLDEVRDLQDQLQQMQQAAGSDPDARSEEQGGASQGRAQASRRRQMERLREGIDRLDEMLDGNARAQSMLQEMRRTAGRADHTGILLGDSAEDFFKDRVFTPLSSLEQELVRQLDVLAMERKLFGARKEDVPPQYREIVEKYYEALAKTRR